MLVRTWEELKTASNGAAWLSIGSFDVESIRDFLKWNDRNGDYDDEEGDENGPGWTLMEDEANMMLVRHVAENRLADPPAGTCCAFHFGGDYTEGPIYFGWHLGDRTAGGFPLVAVEAEVWTRIVRDSLASGAHPDSFEGYGPDEAGDYHLHGLTTEILCHFDEESDETDEADLGRLLARTIVTANDAISWIHDLHEAGLGFHFDDDARDIFDGFGGQVERLRAEAWTALNEAGICPHEISVQFTEKPSRGECDECGRPFHEPCHVHNGFDCERDEHGRITECSECWNWADYARSDSDPETCWSCVHKNEATVRIAGFRAGSEAKS